jgi:hypothetical protein
MNPRIRNTRYILCISYCVFLCLLAACGPTVTPTLFIPPSSQKVSPTAAVSIAFSTPTPRTEVAPTATSAPEISPTPEPPSPTPPCTDSLKYLEDLNYPDGSIVSAGQTLEKQWRVENNGSCNWDARYRLKLMEGFPPLGASGEQALYPALAGTSATLIVKFTIPLEAGTYRTAWQAYGPDGAAFGDAVYMEIIVGQ